MAHDLTIVRESFAHPCGSSEFGPDFVYVDCSDVGVAEDAAIAGTPKVGPAALLLAVAIASLIGGPAKGHAEMRIVRDGKGHETKMDCLHQLVAHFGYQYLVEALRLSDEEFAWLWDIPLHRLEEGDINSESRQVLADFIEEHAKGCPVCQAAEIEAEKSLREIDDALVSAAIAAPRYVEEVDNFTIEEVRS